MKQTKLTRSARGKDCTLRIPFVCNRDPATVVLCHAPYPGKSGTRTDDFWAAYGCSSCHDYVDGRTKHNDSNIMILSFWAQAIHETQKQLIEHGLITIGGKR